MIPEWVQDCPNVISGTGSSAGFPSRWTVAGQL